MTRRFTGPIGKSVTPWQAGVPLIARGRVLVQQCLDRMTFGGLKQFVAQERLPDGSTIRALAINQGTGAPLIRVWIERQVGGETRVSAYLALDHGWRVVHGSGLATVYVDTEIKEYYEGPGTDYSSAEIDIDGHLSGRVRVEETTYRFSDAPTLDADLTHPSIVCIAKSPCVSSVRYVPHEYSGLTRLLVQAFNGIKRSLTEVAETGWADNKALGFQRGPDGQYWIFYLAANLTAHRLNPPAELVALHAFADTATLTGIEQDLLDAFVISLLQADPEGPLIEVASEAAVAPLYADEASTLAPVRPWAWRNQKRGASDEHTCGCVTVLAREIGFATTYRVRSAQRALEVQFTEDPQTGEYVPSGVLLTLGEVKEWVADPGIDRIWRVGVSACRYFRASTVNPTEEEGPIDAFYGDDGTVVGTKYNGVKPIYEVDGSVGNPTPPSSLFCGAGVKYRSWLRVETTNYSGFTIGNYETSLVVAGVQEDGLIEDTLTHQWIDVEPYGIAEGTYSYCCDEIVVPNYAPDPQPQVSAQRIPTMSQRIDFSTKFVTKGARDLVLSDDRQAVFIREFQQGTRTVSLQINPPVARTADAIRTDYYGDVIVGTNFGERAVPCVMQPIGTWPGAMLTEEQEALADHKAAYINHETAYDFEVNADDWAAFVTTADCQDQYIPRSFASYYNRALTLGKPPPTGMDEDAFLMAGSWVGGV